MITVSFHFLETLSGVVMFSLPLLSPAPACHTLHHHPTYTYTPTSILANAIVVCITVRTRNQICYILSLGSFEEPFLPLGTNTVLVLR